MSNTNLYQLTKQIHTEIDRLRESGREIIEIESLTLVSADNQVWHLSEFILEVPEDSMFLELHPENLRQLIIDVWKPVDDRFENLQRANFNILLGFQGLYWQSQEKALTYLLEQLKNVK